MVSLNIIEGYGMFWLSLNVCVTYMFEIATSSAALTPGVIVKLQLLIASQLLNSSPLAY